MKLTAGRFFTIYNPDLAIPIEDEARRYRFESKRDADLAAIHNRMEQVEVERAYRVVGALERTARDIEEKVVPLLSEALDRWRNRVLWGDLVAIGLLGGLLGTLLVQSGLAQSAIGPNGWLQALMESALLEGVVATLLVLTLLAVHFGVRTLARTSMLGELVRQTKAQRLPGDLKNAFQRSTRPWRSIFLGKPVGWGRKSQEELNTIIRCTDDYVQALNDRFTNPSGTESQRAIDEDASASLDTAVEAVVS
jgi:hypothetical protein